MKHGMFLVLLGLAPSLSLAAQPSTQPLRGDQRSFDVQAIGTAVPALKYELTVDAIERQPGDAAALYMQAMLLFPTDAREVIDRAQEAHDQGKSLVDDAALTQIFERSKPVFDLLALASCREQCDWNVPYREQGLQTLLPQLSRLRMLANLLRVRCYQQIGQGKVDDAVATIRMEYALGRNAPKGMPLVGGLVGVGITAVANGLVEDLCALPGGPNLYWPLRVLPQPAISLRDVMDSERQYLVSQVPVLAKGKSGNITAEDWPIFVRQWESVQAMDQPKGEKSGDNLSGVALGLMSLPGASKFYAQTRHIPLEDVSKVDSKKVLAVFFIEQYQIVMDEQTKVLSLPTNEVIIRFIDLPERLKQLGVISSNIASLALPSMTHIAVNFGRVDRQVAALTAVQAIRAYAADHNDQFPAKMEDVLETPIPLNPMTGKMFDYRVDGQTAILSDTSSSDSDLEKGSPLIYTLRIQKR